MSGTLRSLLRSWGTTAGRVGFFLLLVAGSAAAGIAIAWPLWYFATQARGPYTAFALGVAGAGMVYLIVRAIIRAGNVPRDATPGGRSALSVLLAAIQCVVFLAGLYLVAALFFHRIWLFAIPLFLIWIGLLVLLGLARRGAKTWSRARIVPKIRKE